MARSPTHKFGQIIGELIEEALQEPLVQVAEKHGLYLDYKHSRPARDGKRKVTWTDRKGNRHDLDYVLEYQGSEEVIGRPKAFIEIAWRRYTKHSRNKAQEIQGAILPLAETYRDDRPFLGVVLAGVFTQGSITQLRSNGFGVLYFPYTSILDAFRKMGIDADFDEYSSDSQVQKKVQAYEKLGGRKKNKIASYLRIVQKKQIQEFVERLSVSLNRKIEAIIVITLHGVLCSLKSTTEAMEYIRLYDEKSSASPFVRYEIQVRYTNRDEIRGAFENKNDAMNFLANV